ncbi:MAG: DUF47 family protein [Micromonosporaceae bacterium]|nr:DUF47 family protein [Micromonosporaceae bacterium]
MKPIRLLRDLSGRGRVDMMSLLGEQVSAASAGARTARQAATAALDPEAARKAMGEIEHRGDDARARLVAILATSLVTPFDREDMFRISRSIDDVLDNLRDFVRELHLFGVREEGLAPVIDEVVAGLDLLGQALAAAADSTELGPHVVAARKHCNEIRRTYELQLVRLLDGEVTAEMLRGRELLRRLDVVGLRLGEAVDALADAAVKRGIS